MLAEACAVTYYSRTPLRGELTSEISISRVPTVAQNRYEGQVLLHTNPRYPEEAHHEKQSVMYFKVFTLSRDATHQAG